MAAWLLAAAICCIHLGVNEYLSVQFLAFALTAFFVWPMYVRQSLRMSLVAAVLVAVIIAGYVLAEHDTFTLLKGIRSILVLLALSAWQQHLHERGAGAAPVARHALLIACVVSLMLALGQFVDSITINTGLLELPRSFYGIEYGTLLAERRETGLFSRPSALFSEPSALGAFGVLAVAVSFVANSVLLRVLGFAIIITSQSLSGLVLSIGISLISARWRNGQVLIALVVVASAGAAFLLLGTAGERLLLVLTATDLSARIRLFEPVLVLRDLFAAGHYFGASPKYIMGLAAPEVVTVFDNWLINQFLLYGVLGLVWVALALPSVTASLWPLFGAYMVTNGDALYYDRYFLLLVAMAAVADVGSKKADALNRNDHPQ